MFRTGNKSIAVAFTIASCLFCSACDDASSESIANSPSAAESTCDGGFLLFRSKLMKLASKNDFENAEKMARAYQGCYESNPRYWIARILILPSAQPGSQETRESKRKALQFVDHAISVAPSAKEYQLLKSKYLFELGYTRDAVMQFESGLQGIESWRRSVPIDIRPVVALDILPKYLKEVRRYRSRGATKKTLLPLLRVVCAEPNFYVPYSSTLAYTLDYMGSNVSSGGAGNAEELAEKTCAGLVQPK